MTYLLTIAMLLSGQAPADADGAKSAAKPATAKSNAAQPSDGTAKTEEAPADEGDAKEGTPADAKSEGDAPEDSPGEGDEEDDDAESSSGFADTLDEIMDAGAIGLLRQGGFFMWPILIMGIVAAGVIIERFRSLKMLSSDSGDIRSKVISMLESDQVEDALTYCDQQHGPVPAILTVGLRKFLVLRRLNYDAGRIEEQVVKAMDDYSVHIVAALERHLPILATVSSAAPMLGFLGTVQGMIVAFQDIVEQMGETNIVEAAAAGISVALLTTCFGLVVGLPAFVAFNYFTSVINSFVLDVEATATELIETVTLHMALERHTPDNGTPTTAGQTPAQPKGVPVTSQD